MRSRWNLPVYLVYVVVCLAVAAYVVKGIGVRVPWSHPAEVVATFRNGDGILANNEVYENGVKVGRVSTVEAVAGKARVTMVVEDERALPLYVDAMAQVRKKNLLGETYVELVRGTQQQGALRANADNQLSIAIDHTITPVDIDQVLAILDPTTRDRVKLLINAAGDSLVANGQNLNDEAGTSRQLFTELQTPAKRLSIRKQQLDDIIVELEKLYTMLARQRDEIRQEFVTWSDVNGQLANQEAAIGGTLQQADSLLSNLDVLLTGEIPNLRSLLSQAPGTLSSTQAFLAQANTVFNNLVPVRRSIHDVFPDLQTTFADSDPSSPLDPITHEHQHFWSVFSVSCNSDCTASGTSTSTSAQQAPQAPNADWAAVMGASG